MAWHRKKDHKCPICNKDFDTPRQLRSHVKDAHTNMAKDLVVKKESKK